MYILVYIFILKHRISVTTIVIMNSLLYPTYAEQIFQTYYLLYMYKFRRKNNLQHPVDTDTPCFFNGKRRNFHARLNFPVGNFPCLLNFPLLSLSSLLFPRAHPLRNTPNPPPPYTRL